MHATGGGGDAASATAEGTSAGAEGSICWVAPGSPRCWAVSSSDTAPALMALGAEVEMVSPDGERRIPLEALYHDDGMAYLTKRPDEVLTRIHVPVREERRSTYWKLRRRGSFDFPVLGVAVAVDLAPSGEVTWARIALGAVASYPMMCDEAAKLLVGGPLTDDRIDACAQVATRRAKPLDNTDHMLGWRKQVTPRYVAGALREIRDSAPGRAVVGRGAAAPATAGGATRPGRPDLVARRARKRTPFEHAG
jgi:4-hydroxybenzoyl-CoA reductase subunit beta